MKKVFLPIVASAIVVLISSFLILPSQSDVSTDGTSINQRSESLDPFTEIGISIKGTIHYTQGNTHDIRIEGDPDDVRDMTVRVRNGFLELKYENNMKRHSDVTIFLTSKELESVSVSGSAMFDADKKVSSEEMELTVSGSGTISFAALATEEADVKISGSGNVVLTSGMGEEMDSRISGSGKLKAEKFSVSEFSAKISGSGDCWITVTDELEALISGSGKVYYHGNPEVNVTSSGSGKVVAL